MPNDSNLLIICGPHGSGNHIVYELVQEINEHNNSPLKVEFFSLPYPPIFSFLNNQDVCGFIFPLRDFEETVASQVRRQLGTRSKGFTSYEEQVARGYEQVGAIRSLADVPTSIIWYNQLTVDSFQDALTQDYLWYRLTQNARPDFPPNWGHQVF